MSDEWLCQCGNYVPAGFDRCSICGRYRIEKKEKGARAAKLILKAFFILLILAILFVGVCFLYLIRYD